MPRRLFGVLVTMERSVENYRAVANVRLRVYEAVEGSRGAQRLDGTTSGLGQI